MSEQSQPLVSSELYDVVLEAMTTGITVVPGSRTPSMAPIADGTPILAVGEVAESGETEVRYAVGEIPIASRTFRVGPRSRDVVLGRFTLEKYERRYNGVANLVALHERFLANLGTLLGGSRCILRATLSGDDADVWVPYYAWARGMENMNAVNLQHAVETYYPIVSQQQVWDARDLPERVKQIGASSADASGRTWRDVIRDTTPLSLHAGLSEINENLGHLVFTRVISWYGDRAMPCAP